MSLSMWNLKQTNKQIQLNFLIQRLIGGMPEVGAREQGKSEDAHIQTSRYKINKSWGWNNMNII